MREFNENILESLDNGLAVFDEHGRLFAGTTRSNRSTASIVRMRRRPLPLRHLRRSFVEALRVAREEYPLGTTLFKVPLTCHERHDDEERTASLMVNATVVPLQSKTGAEAIDAPSCSSRTSPSACASKNSCRSPTRWRPLVCSRPVWRTRSTRR